MIAGRWRVGRVRATRTRKYGDRGNDKKNVRPKHACLSGQNLAKWPTNWPAEIVCSRPTCGDFLCKPQRFPGLLALQAKFLAADEAKSSGRPLRHPRPPSCADAIGCGIP